MNKLSEYKVQLLIDFIREYAALYDRSHPDFKNMNKKEQIWNDISEKLNADLKDIKVAWRSLRDQFIKCLKHSKLRASNSLEIGRKYKYYGRLSFLTGYVGVVGGRNPIKCDESTTMGPEDFETTQSAPEFDFVPWPKNAELEDPVDPVSEESATEHWSPTSAKKRKSESNEIEFPEYVGKFASKDESPEEYNVEIFFHALASTVKRFNLSHQEFASLQCDVTTFVIERLRAIEDNRE